MMNKFKSLILLPILCLGLLFCFSMSNNANAKQVYDISQYQGNITNHQAHNLRHEVNFTILRAQYGSNYQDNEFNHNAYEMTRNRIPYGAYDYSLYSNGPQARYEAYTLYRRAPQAQFYVNDSEENRAGRRLNKATYDWASEIHQLTSKPAILYSDEAFMNKFSNRTRHHYNALWLAAYSNYQPHPGYHYDLWQYTDNHYSRALGKRLDASVFPAGWIKKLAFWTGKLDIHKRHHKHVHIIKTRVIQQNNHHRRYFRKYHSRKSFHININGKRIRLLKSRYRIGSHHKARKSGFRRGPILNGFHTMFDKHHPNSHKAVIPRNYHIIPNNTIWFVHRHTRNMSIISHIKHAYYFNSQYHGWIRI